MNARFQARGSVETQTLVSPQHTAAAAHARVRRVDATRPSDRLSSLSPASLRCRLEIQSRQYRLACKAGVLQTLYGRSDLRILVEQTVLAHVWRARLKGGVGCCRTWEFERQLPLSLLLVWSCAVRGGVKCSCFKAGRKCNSRCHKGNVKCKNDHDDNDE
eukprot:6212085-Pleurochrysis_carterae.AAC.1